MLIRRRMFVFCFSFFVSSLIFSSLSQSAKLVSAAFFACALIFSAILLRICSADGDKRKNVFPRRFPEKNKIRIFAVLFSSLLLASLFSAFTFFRMYDIPEKSVTDDTQISASVVSRIWSSSGSGGYKVRFGPADGGKSISALAVIPDESLEPGDEFTAHAAVHPLSDAPLPGGERYLQSLGISLYVEVNDGVTLTGNRNSLEAALSSLRSSLSAKIRTYIGKDAGALCAALLTGDRSALPDKVRLDFSSLGISHLLAISGLHMTVLFGAASALIRRTRLGRRSREIIPIVLALMYAALTGFSSSVMRAAFMLILTRAASLIGRRTDTVTVLGEAAFLICIFDPCSVFDVGFPMSVLSVLALTLFASPAERIMKSRTKIAKALLFIPKNMLMTLAVSAMTLPVTCLEFQYISLAAPLANTLFIPLVTLLMYLLVPFSMLLPFPSAASIFGKLCSALASAVLSLSSSFASLPGITVSSRYPFFFPLSLLLVISLASLAVSKRRKIPALLLAFCLCAISASVAVTEIMRSDTVSIRTLSDGKNDIVAVEDASQLMIIDASSGYFSFASDCIDEEYDRRFSEIGIYVFTHYHSRCVPLMKRLTSNYRIGEILVPEPMNEEERTLCDAMVRSTEEGNISLRTFSGEVSFSDVSLSTGARCWISDSSEAVFSFTVSAFEKNAVYLSSSFFKASPAFCALTDAGDSDLCIFGSHGPKYKETFALPRNFSPKRTVFLGSSADFFPAGRAVGISDSGGLLLTSEHIETWKKD